MPQGSRSSEECVALAWVFTYSACQRRKVDSLGFCSVLWTRRKVPVLSPMRVLRWEGVCSRELRC